LSNTDFPVYLEVVDIKIDRKFLAEKDAEVLEDLILAAVNNAITKAQQLVKIKITRLAYGLPAGGDLEFADEVTLWESLQGRREVHP